MALAIPFCLMGSSKSISARTVRLSVANCFDWLLILSFIPLVLVGEYTLVMATITRKGARKSFAFSYACVN